MLTPREFDQIQLALFGMAKQKFNGRVLVDHDHALALLKSFTSGELVVSRVADDELSVRFVPAEEETK